MYRDKKVEGQRGRQDVGQSGAMSEEMGGGYRKKAYERRNDNPKR